MFLVIFVRFSALFSVVGSEVFFCRNKICLFNLFFVWRFIVSIVCLFLSFLSLGAPLCPPEPFLSIWIRIFEFLL